MKNNIILGIDTSTDNCSVALLNQGEIVAKRAAVAKSAHSEKLIGFISEIFKESSVTIDDIDAIGINIGPGSFTGLRIGLSTAKGLAFPNNIPVYPVKSLPVLIRSNNEKSDVCYMIKSHKNMVFYHHFTNTEKNLLDIDIQYNDITDIMKENPNLEIVANSDFINEIGRSNAVMYPCGESVAQLVYENLDLLKNSSGDDIEPYYLTSFQTQKWSGNKK